MSNIPYYSNQELVAMKEDLADRKFNVRMKGLIITGLLFAAAIATMFFVPGAAGMLTSGGAGGAKLLLGGLLAAGGAITSLVTMKEIKRLEIDEKYVQSYMQGKNYWGEGYREEVAEHGYSLSAPQFPGAPPRSPDKGR